MGLVILESFSPKRYDRIIGHRLRALRRMRGLSMEGGARDLGITFRQLLLYEQGEACMSAGRLYEAGKLLDVSLEELMTGERRPR